MRSAARLVRVLATSMALALVTLSTGCGGAGNRDAAAGDALARRIGTITSHATDDMPPCTASVVTSPHKNVIATAAHCVHHGKGGGYRKSITFTPAYGHGNAPYGDWTAKTIIVDRAWRESSDPDHDVAFVVLQPKDGKNIGDVVGATDIVFNTQSQGAVTVTGYPAYAETPITCTNEPIRDTRTQMRFECPGFADGTSGSPWLATFGRTGSHVAVVGVIGGYLGGGDTDDVSYSAFFGDAVQALYARACDVSQA